MRFVKIAFIAALFILLLLSIGIAADAKVTGKLKVTSNPSKADVYIHEKQVGKTPYTSGKLAAGTYSVVVKKKGYEDYKTNVKVVVNKTTPVHAKLKKTNSCKDCDDGIDYYKEGTISGTESGKKFKKTDECMVTLLREYYCASTGESAMVDYACKYGCGDGACIKTPTYEIIDLEPLIQESYCKSAYVDFFPEYIIDYAAASTEQKDIEISCYSDSITIDVPIDPSTRTRHDTIMALVEENLEEVTFDECNEVLINEEEKSKDERIVGIGIKKGSIYEKSTVCIRTLEGQTVKLGNPLIGDFLNNNNKYAINWQILSPECSDSDGGVNYYVKGVTKWFFNNQWWDTSDYCVSSDNRLAEHYCPGGAVTYYTCPNGCEDGVCTK